jgi:microsomal dipeptidase-like Zn-dependent dipeptidase
VILVLDEGKAWDEAASGAYRRTCGGQLRPWGYARVRQIRQLDGSHVEHRPRRFACVFGTPPIVSMHSASAAMVVSARRLSAKYTKRNRLQASTAQIAG